MEAANQVAAYISKLSSSQSEILIYIRCKHKIYVDLKGLTRLSLKQMLPLTFSNGLHLWTFTLIIKASFNLDT